MFNNQWRSLVIGSGLLYGGTSEAVPFGKLPAQAGIGVHKHFGDDSGWGLELYGNLYTYVTPNYIPLFAGGNLQVNFQKEEPPTVVYSAQGGLDLYLLKGGLELGLATQNGQSAFQYGVNIQPLIVPSYIFRSAKGLDKRYHGLGIRVDLPSAMIYDFSNQVVVGRPLRTESGIANYPTFMSADQLPNIWLKAAIAEWASIPAFEDLVCQLVACNAPKNLVKRAKKAMDDELKHTILCAEIASKHLGEQVVLPEIHEAKRKPAYGAEGLIRLALESWFDGCLNEGLAAEKLKHRLQKESDSDAQNALLQIIPEELEHAQLAWDVIVWTIESGGSTVRQALIDASQSQPSFVQKSWEQRFHAKCLQRLSKILQL